MFQVSCMYFQYMSIAYAKIY